MTPDEVRAARKRADADELERRTAVDRKIRRIKREAAARQAAPPAPGPERDDAPKYCPTEDQIRDEAEKIKAETLAARDGARRIKNLCVPMTPREIKVYRDPRRMTWG